ncbi:MAG: YkgJ family cysteine cluster protein [Promethearchaeota archaeon]|nr:MAG: YkgJ family cysteine cluster protein [Candidatus Lokiarchaeota archaeon]
MKVSVPEKIKFICLNCGKCCLDTEMEISNKEVESIEKLGYSRKKFTLIENGYLRLKNIKGHCYFYNLENRKCIIYENRPLGCRFYPLVLNQNTCEIDEECSCYEENKKIEIPKEICKKLKKYVMQLDNEIKERLKQ